MFKAEREVDVTDSVADDASQEGRGLGLGRVRAALGAAFGVDHLVVMASWIVAVVLGASPLIQTPGAGVDRGWITGLAVAQQEGLKFGSDLVFTYGPWGYLDYPVLISRRAVVSAVLFTVVAVFMAWLALRRAFARTVRDTVAAPLAAAAVVMTIPGGGASAMLLIAVSLFLLDHLDADRELGWGVLVPASIAAAWLVQLKFSEGVALVVMVGIAALVAPGPIVRRAALAVGTFLLATVVLWMAAGQRLGDLPKWLVDSGAISRGYTEAMSLEAQPNAFGYLMMAAMAVAAVVLWFAATRRLDRRRAVAIAGVSAMLLYLGFREASGRHDVGHEPFFFILAMPPLIWLAGLAPERTRRLLPGLCAIALGINGYLNTNLAEVKRRWSYAVELVADARFHHSSVEQARQEARVHYDVPVDLLGDTSGGMASDGWEAAVAWAYSIPWRPAPVFQSYVAYNGHLDALNRDWLVNAPSNRVILRPPNTGIDERNSLWDPPNYVLAEICSTEPGGSNESWLVLRPSSDRCGQPQELDEVTVRANESVRVPQVGPNTLVTVSFVPDDSSLADGLTGELFKTLTPLRATLDGRSYRLPRALAAGPLVVNVPESAGWPDAFGGSAAPRTIAFSEPGVVRFSTRELAAP